MPNMDMTEAIIEAMKQYPMLYDSEHADYRNLRKKNSAWEQLGAQFGEEGETMKRKWKNIRDSYAKYLRSLEMDPGSYTGARYAKFWNKWRFASNMEPFKPYMGKSAEREQFPEQSIAPNLEPEMIQAEPENGHGVFVQVYDELKGEIGEPAPFHRKRRHDHASAAKKMAAKEHDALEHLFLYYAKTMRGFSPRRQIQAKMRIAQIMMEEEMEDQNERHRLHAERASEVPPKHENAAGLRINLP